jgi:hypothetical protein
LYSGELHTLYSSPYFIRVIEARRMRWVGHAAQMGEKRNAYKVLVVNPEVKWQLGCPRHRLEDNIKMDFEEIGWEGMDWIRLAQDRTSDRLL